MTFMQWFVFVILPLLVGAAGIIVGESFRAFHMNAASDEVLIGPELSHGDRPAASSERSSQVSTPKPANEGASKAMVYALCCGVLGLAVGWILARAGGWPL
jgi:hypothetical protein